MSVILISGLSGLSVAPLRLSSSASLLHGGSGAALDGDATSLFGNSLATIATSERSRHVARRRPPRKVAPLVQYREPPVPRARRRRRERAAFAAEEDAAPGKFAALNAKPLAEHWEQMLRGEAVRDGSRQFRVFDGGAAPSTRRSDARDEASAVYWRDRERRREMCTTLLSFVLNFFVSLLFFRGVNEKVGVQRANT